MTKLYLAIPCYNEEEVLRDSAEKLLNKYSTMIAEGKITADSRIVFIDDGSKTEHGRLFQNSIQKILFSRASSFQETEVTRMHFSAVL